MSGIFVSYVREDGSLVERLTHDLETHGVKTWTDKKLLPGQRWKEEIRRGISGGDFFLACFSSSYLERSKTYMNEELTLAIEELRQRSTDQTWFIPARLSDCEVPALRISSTETLQDLQRVDFFDDWEDGIRQVLSVVRPQREPIQIAPRELANITHQLVYPLQDVVNTADRLRSGSVPSEQLQEVAESLHASAMHAANQITGMQAVSQLLQEKPVIFPSAINVADEIHGVARLFRAQAQRSHVEFRLIGLRELPTRVPFDRKLFRLVLSNVLDNAIKYSYVPDSEPAVVQIAGSSPDHSKIRLKISNRSTTFSPEDSARIFEAGYRGRGAALEVAIGAGRGLYIARRVMEAHGASITVQTSDNGVVTVELEIPTAR